MIKNVIQSIRDSVEKYTDKIALINGELKFTYADIEDMSNKVCKYLADKSIGKEHVVAIYMDRSYLSVISVLGILKAGAAFLPIDIKTPVKRANFMAITSKAKCVIKDNKHMEGIGDSTFLSFNIHDILSLNKEVGYYINESVDDDSLAYILFTSGSSGLPKGAMIEHGGMNNHLSEKIRILNLSDESIVAHNASISFDVSVWQMLSPLCVGATIIIYPEELILNIKSFINVLHDNSVNVLEVVPTYLNLLMNEMKDHPHNFKDLKYLISTGEVLTKNLADRCFDVLPDAVLVNAYGPTEASDDILHCIIEKIDNYDPIPIGKPINNAEITIVNPDGGLCEINEPGELWVSGICVGRGYVGNDEETKLSFSYDFNTNKRIYKTGDLASLGSDGNFYFHDRLNMQIAFHGKRIEIKEIENTMLKYTGIKASAVVYDPINQRIDACYISDTVINVNDIKRFLKSLLPFHMIPLSIIKLDKMPINISGKTDYNALNEMFYSSNKNALLKENILNEYTPEESKLLKMIMDVIGISQLPDDNNWKVDMRTMGLNSINAIKLVLEVEETYDIEIEEEKLISEILFDYNELKKLIDDTRINAGV